MATDNFVLTTYQLPSNDDIEIDFSVLDIRVYSATVSVPRPPKGLLPPEIDNQLEDTINECLMIELGAELEEIDRIDEGLRYSRSRVLVILGVLSYLFDQPFTINDLDGFSSQRTPHYKANYFGKNEVKIFLVGNDDRSVELSGILEHVGSENEKTRILATSLLDRWRRAIFVLDQIEESTLDEEAFISLFHILELLADHYQENLRSESEDEIRQFLHSFLSNKLLFRGSRLEQVKQDKFKILKEILISQSEISIYTKIIFFLSRVGMLDYQTQALVEKLIEIRNSIAHGRLVYRKDLMWPLPSFFPLHSDTNEYIYILKVLTARSIAAHMNINTWIDEWEDIRFSLIPPADIIKDFIDNRRFQEITIEDFFDGKWNGVRPYAVIEMFISKKIKYQKLEESLKHVLISDELSDEQVYEIFIAAIILADSKDQKLAEACQNIVDSYYDFPQMKKHRDILYELEYRNSKLRLQWFRQWIEQN